MKDMLPIPPSYRFEMEEELQRNAPQMAPRPISSFRVLSCATRWSRKVDVSKPHVASPSGHCPSGPKSGPSRLTRPSQNAEARTRYYYLHSGHALLTQMTSPGGELGENIPPVRIRDRPPSGRSISRSSVLEIESRVL